MALPISQKNYNGGTHYVALTGCKRTLTDLAFLYLVSVMCVCFLSEASRCQLGCKRHTPRTSLVYLQYEKLWP